jgi:energy-converting hydrogenase Eha subunit C
VLQVYVSNVSAVSNVYCKLDVAYVAKAIHICCKCVFQMFQVFHLDVACFHLDVAYVAVAIHVCSKCIFQMFYLFQMYVASVLSRCCYMLQ